MSSVFSMMTPMRSLTKYNVDLIDVVDDEAKFMNFLRMEKWLADRPHHPGEAAKQWLKELYQENRLANGSFRSIRPSGRFEVHHRAGPECVRARRPHHSAGLLARARRQDRKHGLYRDSACPAAMSGCSSRASRRANSARASPTGWCARDGTAVRQRLMRNKIVDAAEAVAIIRSGDTVASSGFVGVGTPDEIIRALERRFIETGEPRDLTLVFAAAPGDGADRGLNRLAHPGLIKRLVGGHFGLVPKLARMAVDNQVEAYNLPLGCVSHLFREIAGRKAGLLSKVGLGTFVDPANGGGKLNARTTEELVRLIEIDGEKWLFYKAFPINVAIIRGTTADRNGNISMEKEALTLDNLALATAAKNCKGFVIAQVERIAATGSLNPRHVKIPSVLIDCVVVAQPENHVQTYATGYNGAFSWRIARARRPQCSDGA
jgi:acyl CoA:acetate/3-ketoacid CoA transferase alpha subunit